MLPSISGANLMVVTIRSQTNKHAAHAEVSAIGRAGRISDGQGELRFMGKIVSENQGGFRPGAPHHPSVLPDMQDNRAPNLGGRMHHDGETATNILPQFGGSRDATTSECGQTQNSTSSHNGTRGTAG